MPAARQDILDFLNSLRQNKMAKVGQAAVQDAFQAGAKAYDDSLESYAAALTDYNLQFDQFQQQFAGWEQATAQQQADYQQALAESERNTARYDALLSQFTSNYGDPTTWSDQERASFEQMAGAPLPSPAQQSETWVTPETPQDARYQNAWNMLSQQFGTNPDEWTDQQKAQFKAMAGQDVVSTAPYRQVTTTLPPAPFERPQAPVVSPAPTFTAQHPGSPPSFSFEAPENPYAANLEKMSRSTPVVPVAARDPYAAINARAQLPQWWR